MSLSSSTAAGLLRPEQLGPLIVQPLKAASTAMQISTNVDTLSPSFRLPVVVSDPAGGWYSEGADIDLTDAEITEIDVVPAACKILSKISNQLANDSSPAAAQVVGQGMARDIARRIDLAFFGNTTQNGPSGLLSLSDVQTVDGGTMTNLDAFAEAISLAESVGSVTTAFCASAATVLDLAQLKALTATAHSPTSHCYSQTRRSPPGDQFSASPCTACPSGRLPTASSGPSTRRKPSSSSGRMSRWRSTAPSTSAVTRWRCGPSSASASATPTKKPSSRSSSTAKPAKGLVAAPAPWLSARKGFHVPQGPRTAGAATITPQADR